MCNNPTLSNVHTSTFNNLANDTQMHVFLIRNVEQQLNRETKLTLQAEYFVSFAPFDLTGCHGSGVAWCVALLHSCGCWLTFAAVGNGMLDPLKDANTVSPH